MIYEKSVFGWLKFTSVKWYKEKEEQKGKENEQFSKTDISQTTRQFLSNWVCRLIYIEGIKDVNFIEISQVVIEIKGAEYNELVVPINNTLVYPMAFFAADT